MPASSSEHAILRDTPLVPQTSCIASPRFLTVKEVASRLSISVSTVWRLSKEHPTFPRRVHIGVRTTRWALTEVEAYEASRRLRH